MVNVDWLRRPIAHRGLHCRADGIIENTVSAVRAALAEDTAIEVDLRPARCGTPMVFHDATLERLTGGQGPVANLSADELSGLKFRDTSDPMMTLGDLLQQVAGQVPLVLEIKSGWSGEDTFARAVTRELAAYRKTCGSACGGHVAVMSFDPCLVAAFARLAPDLARGLVAERFDDIQHWSHLGLWQRFAMRHLLTGARARPHFIAYNIDHLPAAAPLLARKLLGLPLLAWTVRTKAQHARAKRHADAAIFERRC